MATGTYSITAGLSAEILANSVRAVMAWGRSRLLDLTEEQLLEKITLNHRVLVNRMRMFCLDAAQCRSVAADNTWAMLGSLKEHIIDECENSSSGIGNYSSRQDAVGGGPTGAGTGSVGGDSYEAEHAQCENEFESIEIPSEVYLEGKLVRGLRMNMGCEMSVVHSDHVPVTAFTGGTLTFASRVGGQISSYRLARISIRIGPAVVQHEVAVANDLDCPALLGSGVMKPLLRVLLAERKAQAKENDCIDVVVAKQEEEEPSLISGVHEVQQYVDELAHGHGSLKPDGIPVVLEEEDVSQEAVVEHAQLGYDVVVTKQEKVEPGVVSGVHEVQQYVDELEHDQGFPKADDTPVILGNVFEFSDDLFSSDSPVGLGEVFEFSDSFFEPEDPVPTPVQVLEVCPVGGAGAEYPLPRLKEGGAGSSCFSCNDSDVEVILREDCVAVQPLDDLFEFSDSLVSYDSLVGLGDVLDILDQLFVPVDPVPTPVKVLEVCPEGGADVEYPLPMLKEGGAGRTCIDCKNSDDELMVLEDCVVEQSLGDVFDFSDGLYESEDPVPTSVKVLEVCPGDWSNTEYPLPRLKEGGTGGACIIGKASMEEVNFVEDSVVVQPLDHFICVQMEENVMDCGDSVNLVEDSVVVQPLGVSVYDQKEESVMDFIDGSILVEECMVVQPLGASVCDQKGESVKDYCDGLNLVEECVVGLPLVDFVSVENEAFGSVVLHSLLDGMAENLGSAADPHGEKQVELVRSQDMGGTPVLVVPNVGACAENIVVLSSLVDGKTEGFCSAVDPLVEEKVVPMCPQDMGGTPVLVVPSVDACAENDDVFVEGYQKIYDPGAEMLVGLRSSSSLETLCMVSVEGEAIPDNSVSVWFIPYRVKDRGKDAKSEGFGSSVRMGVACHGFCAWAAALQSLETRWLHLGSLEITKATRESSPEEVAWCAFILLTVISVFECFCSVPLFTIPTTDWAEFSMSGATCDSPVAVLCAVEKQEKRLAVFFLILVQLFIVYQWLRIETETVAHECAEMPDENCCDLPPVGCQTLPLHLRPLVKKKGGEMLWSPPLSSSGALQTFS